MGSKNKCALCSAEVEVIFNPMEEWSINGVLCGDCYSKKLGEYYPGDHVRVNKK